MDCKRYEDLMSAALDGALSAEERQELDGHLAQCPACAALFDELREQCSALRELDCPFPDGLHDRIMDGLPEQGKAPVRKIALWRRWGAAAACLVLVIAAARLLPPQPPAYGEPMLTSGADDPLSDDGSSPGKETLIESQFASSAEGGEGPAQRSVGVNPEAAPDETVDFQPAPYAATGDSPSAPAHYGFANDQYIQVTYGYTPETGAQIVGSVQSLDEYTARFPFDGLGDLLRGYDETYFETGRLLAIVLEEPSGSIRHQIAFQGLLRDQVAVVQTSPYGTEDMAAWLILAEVDATFDDGDGLTVTIIPYEEAEP